ncbi:hypothetical protein A0H81_08825 [Grifola frondosa]|uniref:F-box domain-containing protein n=1 Tax=Grifola frondosa TaxID=5627 RepID=A0A1C7M9B9_GRIFR|nr:hypothetical protein A0H81_08825 [Grifola frondosa]
MLKFNVYLYNTRKLESFCAFMVTQAPFRYPFLRHLSIAGFYPMPSSESISQLVEILTHASRLQTLHLSCYDLLKSDHRLQAACSSLTSIKEFHMCWNEGPVFQAQDPLYKMLKQMQSPLVRADLRFFRCNDGIGLDLATLLHSTATLEDLTVSNIAFQSELQFPRLRKLSFSTINYPPLALTARIFPNLTDLTILRDMDHLNAENDRYRQLNRSVQLAGGGWTSLDRLTGWPLDLYSLGLTCPIRCVKIFVYSHNHELVADILSDCRPSQIDIVFNDIFPSVRCLSDEVAARLTYLRCTIHLIYFDRNPIALVSATHYAFRRLVADTMM